MYFVGNDCNANFLGSNLFKSVSRTWDQKKRSKRKGTGEAHTTPTMNQYTIDI